MTGLTLPRLCAARCGRWLTDPESIARGYGPICWDRLPQDARAAIAATLPPKPATPRLLHAQCSRPAVPVDGQLPIDDDPTTEDEDR